MDDRRLLDAREADTERGREDHGGVPRRASPRRTIDRPAATVFGSARVPESDPAYAAARSVGRGAVGAAGR